MYKDLGIIDNYDWSIGVHENEVDLFATVLRGHGTGWYRVHLAYDGSIILEKRMLASGNYDPHPESSRPSLQSLLSTITIDYPKIVSGYPRAINAIKVAFGLQ